MTDGFDFITFDCYGTLIDWEAGITRAFQDAAQAAGVTLEREAILRAYHEIEAVVEEGPYRSYRDVLRETALRCASRLRWALAPDQANFLADSVAQWSPFRDTNPALQRLKGEGWQLGILSNIDDELLAGTLLHLSVEFDLLVTAEHVGSYKPSRGQFVTARERLGDNRWLHVAQSLYHDIEPASTLGIPVVWVNRLSERPSDTAQPTAEVETLAGLVEWLEVG